MKIIDIITQKNYHFLLRFFRLKPKPVLKALKTLQKKLQSYTRLL